MTPLSLTTLCAATLLGLCPLSAQDDAGSLRSKLQCRQFLAAGAEERAALLPKLEPDPLARLVDLILAEQDAQAQRDHLQGLGRAWKNLRALPATQLDAAASRLLELAKKHPRPKEMKLGERMRRQSQNKSTGLAVFVALSKLGPYLDQSQKPLRDAIIDEMSDRGAFHMMDIRHGYFRCLIRAAGPVDKLCKQLEDDTSLVRLYAAEALATRGRDARAAVPALLKALSEEHPTNYSLRVGGLNGSSGHRATAEIQDLAAQALVRIAPEDKRCQPAVLHVVMKGEDPALQKVALRYLGMIGKDAEKAVPACCKLLTHEDPKLAQAAATALGMIGVNNAAVREALERASKRKEKAVALIAAATLRLLQR